MSDIADATEEWLQSVPRQAVLVVDDSPTDLFYLTKLLEHPERHILTAQSGEEALQVLKGFEFALVLLDVHLETMNGFQVAAEIRKSERTRHLPIIFISATSQNEDQVFRGYDAGAVDYLFKPVEPNLLKSKVNVFCELSRQRVVIQHQLEEIQAKNEVLNRQLEEIQTLRGLVPICARCKNVRDDSGFWQSIEAYVSDHSEAEFSHSLCPHCANTLYPGIAAAKKHDKNIRRRTPHA